jgi:hypothetical protein
VAIVIGWEALYITLIIALNLARNNIEHRSRFMHYKHRI